MWRIAVLWAPASSSCFAVWWCHADHCPLYAFCGLYAGSVFLYAGSVLLSLPSIPVVAHKVMGRNRAVTSDLSFPHPRRKGARDVCTPQWLTDLWSCSSSVMPYAWAVPCGVLWSLGWAALQPHWIQTTVHSVGHSACLDFRLMVVSFCPSGLITTHSFLLISAFCSSGKRSLIKYWETGLFASLIWLL